MERDSPDILHTVVLTRLTDEASREGVAEALSRLGGLPVDRVSQRLDALPWTLIKDAARSKTLRLTTILQKLKVEFLVIPPLPESESPLIPESAPLQPKQDQTEDSRMSADPQLPKLAAKEIPSHAPDRPGAWRGGDEQQWKRSIDGSREASADSARLSDITIEPLPLEGVLDPAFRLERQDSWLSAIVLIPWNILAGTLRALASTLDRAFDICKAHFWRLFAIAGIPWIIVAGIALIVIVIAAIAGLTAKSLLELPVWLLVIGVVVAIPGGLVGGALFLFWPQAALIHAISEIYLGREIQIVEAYRFAFAKIVRFVLTSYLMMLVTLALLMASIFAAVLVLVPLLVVLGLMDALRSPVWIVVVATITSMAFIVPLAICLPRLLFFDKAVIIEDSAYGEAFKRSWRLLSGRAGTAWYTSYYWLFGVLLLVLIPLHWAIIILFEGPSLLLTQLLPGPKIVGTYSGQVLSTFGSLLAQVYAGVVNVLFYYCIRSRKEGHDLLALAEMDKEGPMNRPPLP